MRKQSENSYLVLVRMALFAVLLATLAGCCSPLHEAAMKGRTDVLLRMLDEGADIDDTETHFRRTPLMCAARNGRTATARALIERGANIEAEEDLYGWTPLFFAIDIDHADIVRLLLEHGANPEAYDRRSNMDALAFAEKWGRRKIAGMLEEARAQAPMRARRAAQKAAEAAAQVELEAKLPEVLAAEKAGDTARAAGNLKESLTNYVAAIQSAPAGTEPGQRLREKVIALTRSMKRRPAVSEKARKHMIRGQAFLEKAKDIEGYTRAASELEQASRLAPWWAAAYFNLGIVQEKAEDFTGAMRSLNLYLLAAPRASDAAAVQKKIYKLEVAQELAEQ